MSEKDDSSATSSGVTPRGFTHLHLHSEYSLLDGGNRVDKLIDRCEEHGMTALAITDHGNMHVAAEFFLKCQGRDVKPIMGIEAYVAPESRFTKKVTGVADGGFHLVLLAENNTGWQNLLKLTSDSYLNGFYRKPRMDKETLAQWSEGIIAINGHLGSSLAYHLERYSQTNNEAHFEAAKEEARWHAETFGPNEHGDPCFYVELQRHDVQLQLRINPHLQRLAEELGLPLVCDNDAHFLREQDWDIHDTLCCISMGKTKDDPSRLQYPRDLYVKTPEQMIELFKDIPEAVENTMRIADRCNVDLDFSANHAPVVRIASDYKKLPVDSKAAVKMVRAYKGDGAIGSTEWFKGFCSQFRLEPFDSDNDKETPEELKQQCDGALRLLAEAGAIWRYGVEGVDEEKRARLDRELRILADKLISAYFLICWDCMNWARQNGIPASARGSGVGTMVGYVLGLSNACPVHYGLLFERFTDPDRSEYPDIDIDICQDGRGDVIEYVRQKYGHVAQIITFGRLKARAAIKDVARVHGMTPGDGQRLANLVPDELNIRIEDAIRKSPDLTKEYEGNPIARTIIDSAKQLEDHARHAGVHAAGVVIATQPLDNIIPLCKPTNKDQKEGAVNVVTQWDGPTCERAGLLKMDFLGLRTLSTIERTRELIEQSLPDDAIWKAVGRTAADGENGVPHPLDLDRLVYDDARVFSLFQRGDTAGVFQFESGGMRKLLTEMKPDRLEDLIAANALYRPGPMDLIPDYCLRKHGKQSVPKVHEIVDRFTAETYGIMVYQEQVMQIVHGLGDIPLRDAYTLIKAISKKKVKVIDANRPMFIDGAGERGLSKKEAETLFDLILKFAGYGFNKSHSTGYAIIAYQTAYLKTYFPNQYMAALLTYESAAKKVEDWVGYLNDCRNTRFPDHTEETPHVGVDVLPPTIGHSQHDFAVVFDGDEDSAVRDNLHGHVRFGLGAIRNVGRSAIQAIMEERDANGAFESVFDFCERLSSRTVNKACIEALICAGAFDEVHGVEQRSAVLAAVDDAIAAGQTLAEDRQAGQMNFFAAATAGDESESPAQQPARPLPNVPAWDQLTMLAREKEFLGIHVSGHPLDQHKQTISVFCNTTARAIADLPHDAPIVLGAMVGSLRPILTKKTSQAMAAFMLEDTEGMVEAVMFPRRFAEWGHQLRVGAFLVVVGRCDTSRNEPQVIVDTAFPLEEAPARLGREMIIDIPKDDGDGNNGALAQMQLLRGVLGQSTGTGTGRDVPVRLRLSVQGKSVTLRSRSVRVIPTSSLLDQICDIVGPNHVHLSGGNAEGYFEDRKPRWQRKTANAGASAS